MRLAYADPPYLGWCRYYEHDHRGGGCWDDSDTHRDLIARLVADYPDGWALSLSSPTLAVILPMVPADTRVAAWVKPFAAFKSGVRPAYAWEPILFRGGRNPTNGYPHKWRRSPTPRDYVIEPISLRRGLTGAKPARVCRFVLDLLNARPDDEVDDLFPGTGAMGAAIAALAGRPIGDQLSLLETPA